MSDKEETDPNDRVKIHEESAGRGEANQRSPSQPQRRVLPDARHVMQALSAIARTEAKHKESLAVLEDKARTAAIVRKTEADDLARRHQVAEHADQERLELAKKRAHSIFNVCPPPLSPLASEPPTLPLPSLLSS